VRALNSSLEPSLQLSASTGTNDDVVQLFLRRWQKGNCLAVLLHSQTKAAPTALCDVQNYNDN
jgi:hypothetical protein